MHRMPRRTSALLISTTAVAATLLVDSYFFKDRHLRVLRVAASGSAIIVDYKTSTWSEKKGSSGYLEAMEGFHDRTATRLLSLCLANKGGYTKIGQHIASMNHVLPKAYTTTLVPLQDQATPVSYDAISQVILEEFNVKTVFEVFKHIDTVPIAAASLAQVHKGKLFDGTEVAIKLQYPGLARQMANDLWTMEKALQAIEWFFPDFAFQWILPEFEVAMHQELDFESEKDNARRIDAIFNNDPAVHVPHVFDHVSTKRVLTMEYIDGVKITNVEGIRALGLEPQDIATLVSNLFGHMIFCEGFVHCDPHPGNLFVRQQLDGKPQVVLLDHGIYRDLDEPFRQTFCQLWKALLLRDEAGIHRCAVEFGAGPYADLFPLIFTYRSLNHTATARLEAEMSSEEKKRVGAVLKHLNVGDANAFMQFLPRDMLFVFRVTNLVRALNKELGGTSRSRFHIMGKKAVEGLDRHDPVSPSTFRYYYHYAGLWSRLWLIDTLLGWQQYWSSSPPTTTTVASASLASSVETST